MIPFTVRDSYTYHAVHQLVFNKLELDPKFKKWHELMDPDVFYQAHELNSGIFILGKPDLGYSDLLA